MVVSFVYGLDKIVVLRRCSGMINSERSIYKSLAY